MEALQNMELKLMLKELSDMLLAVYGNKLKSVILYGSVARGTASNESDVDILVLVDGTDRELRNYEDKLGDVSTDISIKYFKVLSIVDVNYQEFQDWQEISPFYRNISKEGVVLYAA
ncbi:MAG: nucleotidyltransferase domain-containing protein [Lachnospiraceae bacterium]|nr:nucleotidyltransferase domain-containing protein [Lachnospiraceae bacterium]